MLYNKNMAHSILVKQVNPKVLAWAREGIGFDVELAAEKTKIAKEKIIAFEQGEEVPTKAQLVKLAHAYKRPWVLFLMPEVPKHTQKKPKWRTLPEVVNSLSAKSLVAIRRAEDLRDIYSELSNGTQSLLINKKYDTHNSPERAAELLREIVGISVSQQIEWEENEAFDRWRSAIERQGVMVLQGPLDVKEVRAFSIVESTPFVIFVSNEDTVNAKTFSLIHELAHILIRDSSLCNMSDFSDFHARRAETFCNQVAGSFLVPASDLINNPLVNGQYKDEWDDQTLGALARKQFKVSKEVVLRRLVTLKLASQKFYEEKKDEWAKIPPKKPFGINKDGEARVIKTSVNANGYAMTGVVLENLSRGTLTLAKASDYLKLKPKYFSKLERMFNWYG